MKSTALILFLILTLLCNIQTNGSRVGRKVYRHSRRKSTSTTMKKSITTSTCARSTPRVTPTMPSAYPAINMVMHSTSLNGTNRHVLSTEFDLAGHTLQNERYAMQVFMIVATILDFVTWIVV